MRPPFHFRWVTVTPLLAREWLKKNSRNRRLRSSVVDAFAADMLAGEWIPNHQGIALGEDGILMDGQHRLAAIVQSGVPVPMLVCEGVPTAPGQRRQRAMDTIDRGTSRTIADVLRLSHGVEASEVFVTAVATQLLELATPGGRRAKSRVTLRIVLQVLEMYGAEVRWLVANRPVARGLNSAFALAPFVLARREDASAAAAALAGFASGAGLDEGSPVLLMRTRALASRNIRRREDRLAFTRQSLACLAAHIDGAGVPRMDARALAAASERFLPPDSPLVELAVTLLARPVGTSPVVLTDYATSLVKAVETSEKIAARIRRREGA